MSGTARDAASVEIVPVRARSLDPFADVLPVEHWRRVVEAVEVAGGVLAGRTVWNVNSTARGGGVAELLRSLIAYARGAGVDARWVTIAGDAPFFTVTKRIHNRLHGSPGDGGGLADAERRDYERPLRSCAAALAELIAAEDLVILHDPQTAGLVPLLRETGARIAWRSHIGHDEPNELAREAWRFLLPYVRGADVCIFSRPAYAWGGIENGRLAFIHPSIDVFSLKNRTLGDTTVHDILERAGVIDGAHHGHVSFERTDGGDGRLVHQVELTESMRLQPDTPVVLQVSRWDRLKDPVGVIEGFTGHVSADSGAHLLLAGPDTAAVADDPEGTEVFAEVRDLWHRIEPATRARVHLASIPMDDAEENALIVNALQRHATVVVQKSLAEGFGLTVAEAMWKSRPVVASRVGGIQDQVRDGISGVLVDDPRDLASFGAAVSALLEDPARAADLGRAAHERARDEFLGPEHLMQYLALFQRLLADGRRRAGP